MVYAIGLPAEKASKKVMTAATAMQSKLRPFLCHLYAIILLTVHSPLPAETPEKAIQFLHNIDNREIL